MWNCFLTVFTLLFAHVFTMKSFQDILWEVIHKCKQTNKVIRYRNKNTFSKNATALGTRMILHLFSLK